MDIKACNDKNILVFAGTFEGHALAKAFSQRGWQNRCTFCVATEYGAETISDVSGLAVKEGRLTAEEMKALFEEGGYTMVIDATHPYAKVVTENIQKACAETDTAYVRLLREESRAAGEGIVCVASISEAVEVLNRHHEKVLLTTGAKELSAYSGITDIEERVVARVLPTAESIESCLEAGIAQKHIAALQGPFTKEMNLAMMEQYGCRHLVTKNTGKPGGFDDKVAVLEAGYSVIVIGRPAEETGFTLEEVLRKAEAFYAE